MFNFSNGDMPEIRRRIKKELKKGKILLERTPDTDDLKRRISNVDRATCWLNSCLQLLLCGFDFSLDFVQFNSRLGIELQNLHQQTFIDPTRLKKLLQKEIDENSDRLQRDNILLGQQCARDFLIIISENKENWLDVYNKFHHVTVQTLTCPNCKRESKYRSSNFYREIACPPDNSRLRNYIQQTFCCSEEVDYLCEDGCKKRGFFKKNLKLCSDESSEFIIIVLTRGISNMVNNYENKVVATDHVIIDDSENRPQTYMPISIIEYEGSFLSSKTSQGHYTCDVKSIETNNWYRTNDEFLPQLIQQQQVTKSGYVILYKKI